MYQWVSFVWQKINLRNLLLFYFYMCSSVSNPLVWIGALALGLETRCNTNSTISIIDFKNFQGHLLYLGRIHQSHFCCAFVLGNRCHCHNCSSSNIAFHAISNLSFNTWWILVNKCLRGGFGEQMFVTIWIIFYVLSMAS